MAQKNFSEFKPQPRISTSCPEHIQKMAFDKAISWSEALERGVKEIALGGIPNDTTHIIERPTKLNLIHQLKAQAFQMDKLIKQLEDEHSLG